MDDPLGRLDPIGKIFGGISSFAQTFKEMRPGLAMASNARGEVKRQEIAQKAAESAYRSNIERGVSPEISLSLARSAANAVVKDERVADTMAIAAEQISNWDKAINNAENIDGGWFEAFADHAGRETDDEIRIIWAKILSGELENPGSFSKRFMSILADMGQKDAEDFRQICSMIVSTMPRIKYSLTLVIEADENGTSYNESTLSFEQLSNLEALGLLSSKSMNYTIPSNGSIGFWYGEELDRSVNVKNETGETKLLKFMGFQTTRCGDQLASLCEIGTDPMLAERIIRICKGQGFTIWY